MSVYCELTLIRQEIQHGLQQEGQVAHRQAWVAHAAGGIDQLVQQAHLYSSPASVGAWDREDRMMFTLTRLAKLITDICLQRFSVITTDRQQVNTFCRKRSWNRGH